MTRHPRPRNYLLTTHWLKAFDEYLDYRVRYLQEHSLDRLIEICRAFPRNPLKLGAMIGWFLRAAPARRARLSRLVPVAPPRGAAPDRSADEGEERQRLKAAVESKLDHVGRYDDGRAVELAGRIHALAFSRRNAARIPIEAGRYLLASRGRSAVWGQGTEAPHRINVSLLEQAARDDGAVTVGAIAPGWLQPMLRPECVPPVEDLDAPPKAVLLCLGRGGPYQRALDWLNGSGTARSISRIFWHHGTEVSAHDVSIARQCDFAFASHPASAGKLEDETGGSVVHLPPAVQPKLHNPLYAGEERDAAVHGDPDMPDDWKAVMRSARGECADVPSFDNAGKDWMDAEMLSAVRARLAIRKALTEDTIGQRLDLMGRRCGVRLTGDRVPLVSVVVSTKRPGQIRSVFETIAAQRHPRLELILVLHGGGFDESSIAAKYDEHGLQGSFLRVPSDRLLGECLQLGTERCAGSIVTKMDDDDLYGSFYLSDMLAMLQCSEAAVVGKRRIFRFNLDDETLTLGGGSEYAYTTVPVSGSTIMLKKEVFDEVMWRPLQTGEDTTLCNDCFHRAIPILAADRFNHVKLRSSGGDHTWRVSDEQWLGSEPSFFPAASPNDVLV